MLAFRAEITRVATLMYARDTSGAVYPQSGIRDGFHAARSSKNLDGRLLQKDYSNPGAFDRSH